MVSTILLTICALFLLWLFNYLMTKWTEKRIIKHSDKLTGERDKYWAMLKR